MFFSHSHAQVKKLNCQFTIRHFLLGLQITLLLARMDTGYLQALILAVRYLRQKQVTSADNKNILHF